MPDIIQLLPDSVANQIAAGEVVQRPASAVKELIENAVDSGADKIQLIVKDAGKTLIQVIDNGCGMSNTDARLSFERHATSKIRAADELFRIVTKGFRGEALASIAAIAHVEMKTRLTSNELGTQILIQGSEIQKQEPCSTPVGTSISVKNLFFNTPARRNFLKSDPVEMRHIIEEFERVALTHPEVEFQLHHNDSELFNLKQSPLRQRVVSIFGPRYNERLVPVKQETAIVDLKGFIGKPEFAKRTRGEQYFFVNNRFIKNSYLHHAVSTAFDELIGKGSHPSYFLYLKVDPGTIDVNIHPTKTEIKFTEERSIYAIVHSAVRNSLGKYNISPSLDFDQEDVFNVSPMPANVEVAPPEVRNFDFNPFESEKSGSKAVSSGSPGRSQARARSIGWEELYEISERERESSNPEIDLKVETERPVLQVHNTYILSTIKSGMIIIHQQRAHERILYEDALRALAHRGVWSQQQLFPKTVELSASDCELLEGVREEMGLLGFTIDGFGEGAVVVNGVPADASEMNIQTLIENILETYKNTAGEVRTSSAERLARSIARNMCIKKGKSLSKPEMIDLIDRLFACEQPQISIGGKPTIVTHTMDDLNLKFKA
jgi:DNA mismatch repair protein MutL